MRRGLLLLSTALAMLAIVPAASADKPIREIFPIQGDLAATDQGAFPVRAHIDGPELQMTYFPKSKDIVRLFAAFPGNTVTVTNLDSGASITLTSTGTFQAQINRDDSGWFKVTGHGPFSPNPETGEPGVWYLSGSPTATVDADGTVTLVRSTGTLVNLCPKLAS